MFSVTHFRSEFIRQNQADIIRKVTMTQFMLVIILVAIPVGVFNVPYWLAPLFAVAGYVAGYNHNGEFVWKRALARLIVWFRTQSDSPQIVNVQAEWDNIRAQAQRQRTGGLFPTTIVMDYVSAKPDLREPHPSTNTAPLSRSSPLSRSRPA